MVVSREERYIQGGKVQYLPVVYTGQVWSDGVEGGGGVPADNTPGLGHESRAYNQRTCEFSRGMVGSAGTFQPAAAARRSQARRRARPVYDAGVHLRPRLGPANSP